MDRLLTDTPCTAYRPVGRRFTNLRNMLQVNDRVVDTKTGIPCKIVAIIGFISIFTGEPLYRLVTRSGIEIVRSRSNVRFIMRLVA